MNNGISEFINKSNGFYCLIKHKLSDFHVHEIDLCKQVVGLKDHKDLSNELSKDHKELSKDHKELSNDHKELSNDHKESNTNWLNEFGIQSLNNIPLTTEPFTDKEKRKALHTLIKQHYPTLGAVTLENGSILIESFNQKLHGVRSSRDSKYCHFTMCKIGRSTMDFIAWMSKSLRIPNKNFTFAGTKDKRAITFQRISVFGADEKRLQSLNKQIKNGYLCNFSYSKERLMLGDLIGNHFKLALRNVKGSHEEIKKSLESLKNNGFINYFGEQRFGAHSVSTAEPGLLMLQEKWSEAIDLILGINFSGAGNEFVEHWKTHRNPNEALKLLPHRGFEVERQLLKSLEKAESDYLRALQSINRNMRTMYLHAYQSLVWNKAVSARFRIYGRKPVVGDLVCNLDDDVDFDTIEDGITDRRSKKPIVTVIKTAEEAKNYSLAHVVLPLPGVDVIYPENEILQEYKNIMANDNLDPLEMRRKVKYLLSYYRDINLSGAYRRILAIPTNMMWDFKEYSNDQEPLIINYNEQLNFNQDKDASEAQNFEESKTAIILEFSLKSSQYATMALREITKAETSSEFLANQSVKENSQSLQENEKPLLFNEKKRKHEV
jgi:tRNA pseudouridine13 synthase